MIVAKLHVYLQGLIFVRDDLVDCCFHSSFLDLPHSSGHALKKFIQTSFWAAPLRERERAVRFV